MQSERDISNWITTNKTPRNGKIGYSRLVCIYNTLDLGILLPRSVATDVQIVTDAHKFLGLVITRQKNHRQAQNRCIGNLCIIGSVGLENGRMGLNILENKTCVFHAKLAPRESNRVFDHIPLICDRLHTKCAIPNLFDDSK